MHGRVFHLETNLYQSLSSVIRIANLLINFLAVPNLPTFKPENGVVTLYVAYCFACKVSMVKCMLCVNPNGAPFSFTTVRPFIRSMCNSNVRLSSDLSH